MVGVAHRGDLIFRDDHEGRRRGRPQQYMVGVAHRGDLIFRDDQLVGHPTMLFKWLTS